MPKWPPNSRDLSPIELVWSIIKGMLNIFQPATIEELKASIQKIWNSISLNAKICEKIINHIQKRWDLCIKHKGRRLDKQLLRKITSESDKTRLRLNREEIKGIRISYNDKFLDKLKNKDIKEKKRKLKEQISKENKRKLEFDKLMKLKPREYKNIPDKEKKEIKFNYDYEKARREYLEEQIQKINDMTPIEYLNLLNDEIKEKLISLCLDRKILDAFENSSSIDEKETMGENASDDYDDDEKEEGDEEEESEDDFE